jgi:DNA-binding FrmR family transcriptional regulator
MIESERYCIDILTQMSAINVSMKNVGFQLLKNHGQHCVYDAIKKAFAFKSKGFL